MEHATDDREIVLEALQEKKYFASRQQVIIGASDLGSLNKLILQELKFYKAHVEEIDDLIDEYCGSPNPDEMSASRIKLAEAKEELLREWSRFPENYFAPRRWDVWEIERTISRSKRFQECH